MRDRCCIRATELFVAMIVARFIRADRDEYSLGGIFPGSSCMLTQIGGAETPKVSGVLKCGIYSV